MYRAHGLKPAFTYRRPTEILLLYAFFIKSQTEFSIQSGPSVPIREFVTKNHPETNLRIFPKTADREASFKISSFLIRTMLRQAQHKSVAPFLSKLYRAGHLFQFSRHGHSHQVRSPAPSFPHFAGRIKVIAEIYIAQMGGCPPKVPEGERI